MTRYQSLVTGKFVSEYYAKRHPKTTREVPVSGKPEHWEDDPGAALVRGARRRAAVSYYVNHPTIALKQIRTLADDAIALCDLVEQRTKERDTFAARCDRHDAMMEEE